MTKRSASPHQAIGTHIHASRPAPLIHPIDRHEVQFIENSYNIYIVKLIITGYVHAIGENMRGLESERSNGEGVASSRIGLMVFDTANIGMRVEGVLQRAEIACRVIPTPLEITSECGISLLIEEEWIEKAERVIHDACIRDYRIVFPFVRGKS